MITQLTAGTNIEILHWHTTTNPNISRIISNLQLFWVQEKSVLKAL
jgi:hypothetical protein